MTEQRKMDPREHVALMAGYYPVRLMPTGEVCGIQRQMYTVGLFVGIDTYGYRTRFCFPEFDSALRALMEWDGVGDNPPGPWIKEKGEHRDGAAVNRANPRGAVPT